MSCRADQSCALTCRSPFLLSGDGKSCVSPNTPRACGPVAIACPEDPNGAATCSVNGVCGLACDTPYVLSEDATRCVSPNTVEACGEPPQFCPTDPNGRASCSEEGECLLECDSPYVLNEAGTTCVSPNIPDACGAVPTPCPTVDHAQRTCSDTGVCGFECIAPFVGSQNGKSCVSPNTVQACGPDATPCSGDENGSAVCDSSSGTGLCTVSCNAGFAKTAEGQHCYSSCYTLLAAGLSTGNGEYVIVTPDGSSITVYCDMTTQGGGWTLISPDLGVSDSFRVVHTRTVDSNGGLIVQATTPNFQCGGSTSMDTLTLADGFPWTQVRYRQEFTGRTQCYKILGSSPNTAGSGIGASNLVRYQSPPDRSWNEVAMSPTGNAFDSTVSSCTTNNFWNLSSSLTHRVDVIQRREDRTQPARLSTEVDCVNASSLPAWTYSNIAVRECPMTVAACGEFCSPCEVPANGTAACNQGGCGYSCDTGYLKSKYRVACVVPGSAEYCGPNGLQCDPIDNSTASCMNDQCVFTCDAGFVLAPEGDRCVEDLK